MKVVGAVASCVILCLVLAPGATPGTSGAEYEDAGTWTVQVSGLAGCLSGIHEAGPTSLWAVGEAGAIYRTDDLGANWAPQSSGVSTLLTDVAPVDVNTAWTAGADGVILKTVNGGASWTPQNSTLSALTTLTSISAVDANTAWAVGNTGSQGTVVKTDDGGITWNEYWLPTEQSLMSICAFSSNAAWAVGTRGTIIKTADGGPNWETQNVDVSRDGQVGNITEIAASDANRAWAVVDNGLIIHTADGGATWQRRFEAETARPFRSLVVIDDNNIWAVGSEYGYDEPFVVKTDDGGANWNFQDCAYLGIGLNDMAAIGGDVWCVGGADYGGNGTILHTTVTGGYDYNWYFAEGCTREGFREWLSIQNANPKDIQVLARYMLFGGAPIEKTYTVAANSRLSVNVNTEVGDGQDVAVRLMSADEFYAERPLYFDYKKDIPGYGWSGGHDTMGARAPLADWYFAEGCTREGFEEWLCVQNPNDGPVGVKIDYISTGAETVRKEYAVEANSRISVLVNSDMGPGQDVSAHVFTDGAPIVAERVMYFDYRAGKNPGVWDDGAVVMGVDSPKGEWYFAEGCTREGFEEWLCVQNPNPDAARLDVTYDLMEGTQNETYVIPANSRGTIDVNSEVGPDMDVSVYIYSSVPVICERPLYFNYTGRGAPGWNGGSAEVGVNSPAADWYFAEGYTGDGFHEWLCIQNTGTAAADVTVTYNIQGAAPVTKGHTVPPGRYTIFVNEDAGQNLNVSAHVHSTVPVICERSMYFDYTGWNGGHCAKGYAP